MQHRPSGIEQGRPQRRLAGAERDAFEAATLGTDHGRFSFRSFSQSFTPGERGALIVIAKASNRAGATQTLEIIPNPAGYHHNVVQRIAVTAV